MTENQINLPLPNRYITTHDPETGKAVFSNAFPVQVEYSEFLNARLYNLFTTSSHPVELANEADIEAYKSNYPQVASLNPGDGVVLRMIDFPPNPASFPHRTESIDFGVVLEGELELILSDGVSQVLKRGDVFVQRATVHEWRNPSETDPVRFLAVILPAKPAAGPNGKLRGELMGSWEETEE